ENCFVSSRAVAKICFQPINKTLAIMNVSRFNGPFDSVRINIGACRECRRKPTLLPQERQRRKTAVLITHDGAVRDDACDGGRDRKHRLRAGMRPGPFGDLLRSRGACLRSRGRAESEERGLESPSANADCPSARQGASGVKDLRVCFDKNPGEGPEPLATSHRPVAVHLHQPWQSLAEDRGEYRLLDLRSGESGGGGRAQRRATKRPAPFLA